MNIKIKDGRTDLFQWDTERYFTIDEPCDYVHMSNLQYGKAYTVKVVENEAMIPDELLQNGGNIYAYGFVGSPENGYTEQMQMFPVRRKPKPSDYVFTPTEQLSLQKLNDKIDEVASKQDPDAIKNAVDDYLKENPIDAAVLSVNGKKGDVKLTAEDVGAISQDDLQQATNDALTQAKESGEFDGKTPEKGIDYFTESDKAEFVADVLEALPTWNGGAY